jgi:hypothetical protein
MKSSCAKLSVVLCAAVLAALVSPGLLAQQSPTEAVAASPEAAAVAPEAPVEPKPASDPVAGEPVDKRILGVLPNYRTADGTLPFQPISSKYKLTIAAKDSFDWPNYIVGGVFAGIYQLEDSHPQFGQGVAGYARYYGTSYGDQVIGNMLTEGFMPILFHQDPRYFRKAHGSTWGRLGYALTRVLICKTDSGKPTFNFSEVIGNGAGASIANLYYADDRGFSPTMTRMSTQIATDALSNTLKEFWPDIKRHLHKKPAGSQAFAQAP